MKHKHPATVISMVCFLLAPFFVQAQSRANDIENSVFRITNYQQSVDWQSPWKTTPAEASSGTGFLTGKQLIVTNAHVVSDSRLLIVNKQSTSKPFIADVIAVAHDSDLALLKVRDPRFYNDTVPIPLGEMPEIQSHVRTYGYPMGGQKISRTEGVISRIEFGTYVHPGIDSHLLVQTDSAINPGNSGGPVIQKDQVVGVAFQSNLRLNDVGYFIPVPLILRFLKDIEDGVYDGVPEIGVITSDLLNPSQRKFLGLDEAMGGVLVERVLPMSSAENLIFPGDVLLKIETSMIDMAGMVHYEGHRISFFIEAENRQIGDSLNLTVLRNQSVQTITLQLKPPPYSQEIRNSYDVLPEYLIVGGLVFTPLNRNYLQTVGSASATLVYELLFRGTEQAETRREQVVVLAQILPASFNSGYTAMNHFVLNKVNGVIIQSIRHLKEVLRSQKDEQYYVFESQWTSMPIIMNRKLADDNNEKILRQYGIPQAERIQE
ncbi:MAG: trypsin-like peptidase domain-containing protein [SAR324 cluster bacterium]|nr:trypsin-like peptidase domain-containing protein [SAR324 cluster bacterium]